MYRAALLLILALGLVGRAAGQAPARPLTPEEREEMIRQAAQSEIDRQEIVNLEKEAAHAIQLNNPTFFKRVYSDDFTGTLSHGQPVNKASFRCGDSHLSGDGGDHLPVVFSRDL